MSFIPSLIMGSTGLDANFCRDVALVSAIGGIEFIFRDLCLVELVLLLLEFCHSILSLCLKTFDRLSWE